VFEQDGAARRRCERIAAIKKEPRMGNAPIAEDLRIECERENRALTQARRGFAVAADQTCAILRRWALRAVIGGDDCVLAPRGGDEAGPTRDGERHNGLKIEMRILEAICVSGERVEIAGLIVRPAGAAARFAVTSIEPTLHAGIFAIDRHRRVFANIHPQRFEISFGSGAPCLRRGRQRGGLLVLCEGGARECSASGGNRDQNSKHHDVSRRLDASERENRCVSV